MVAGPQATTLAGPCLPPQLLNFHQNSGVRRNRKRVSWPVSLMLGVVLILGVVALLQFMMQDRDIRAASVPSPSLSTPVRATKAAPAAAKVVQEHPAARSVEVAGVRVVLGANKKPQLEYIVINHSAIEITGLNIRIAVRSVDSDAPQFSISNVIAALAPNQSKEIRTDLDPSIQPSAIPDWQSLRTEVLIARQ
jgi:hypothetical protein